MVDLDKYIGIDSVLLRQEWTHLGKDLSRKGLIGVGVEVSNLEKFKKNYEKVFSELMIEHDIETEKPFCCAWELKETLGFEDIHQEIKVLETLKHNTSDMVDHIHFFYTYIFGGRKEISIFGETPYYKKIPLSTNKKGETDFYDLISSAYPVNCAWKLQLDEINAEIHSDNFQGRKCPAWFLLQKDRLKVFYQGDRCNHLISAADIYTRLLKLRMIPNRYCYLEKNANSLLKEEFGTEVTKHYLGAKYLKEISPNDTQRIKNEKYISHPIYFIAKENPKDETETKTIENSPKFSKALKEIIQYGGCFKYYEKGNDSRYIRKGDRFIQFGEKGKKELETFERLDYPITEFK